MLPPLIRDAENPEEHPKHTYYSLTEAECIQFIIELDEAYVGGNKFPLKKFPLRFTCELCDLDFQEPPIELGEIETRALIRAFFLGVKVQINASENRHTNKYNLRIQLSSTLFVECGELIDEDDELTPEDICNQVSLDLYSKSSDFFGSPQDGITVWRVRVAQELFGELKPAPEVFWPPEAEMARRAMMRDAISAMTLPVANANANPALATSPLRASAPILVDAPTNLTQGEAGVFCFQHRRLTDNRRHRFDGGLRLLGCDLGIAEDANDQRANRLGGVLARKSAGLSSFPLATPWVSPR